MTVTSSARRTRAPIPCDVSRAIPPFAVLRKTIPHSILHRMCEAAREAVIVSRHTGGSPQES